MADESLRETIEAAMTTPDTGAAAAPPAPEATPVATPPADAPAQAPAGLDGASAPAPAPEPPKDGDKPAPTAKKPGEESASDPKNAENTVEEPKPTAESRAPKAWKPVNQAKWDSLDPDIRQEITRRERDNDRVLQESARSRKFEQGFRKMAEPFMPRFQQAGVPPEQAVISLLHIDRVLSSDTPANRAQMMAKMIKDYQIDIAMLDSALAGEAPNDPDARLQALVQQAVAPLADFVQNQRMSAEQARQRDFEKQVQTVESMEANTEKYPFMGLVREEMADLIEISAKRGLYLSLDDAYNRAVQMNPESAAQAGEAAKRQLALKANQAANSALNASSSINGAPARAVQREANPNDLRGTIEAAVIAAGGR